MARTKKDRKDAGDDEEGYGVPIRIKAPDIREIRLRLVNTSFFVQSRFSEKAREQIRLKQMKGSTATKGEAKVARDFKADFAGAFHRGPNGEMGIPAPAFRCASIDVCRLVGYKMTLAKLSLFIRADFFDPRDGTPLVQIHMMKGHAEPVFSEKMILPVRNAGAGGVADLRARPMWQPESFYVDLRVQYDAGQFTEEDVANLVWRVGVQNGIGEGRNNSKKSAGCGWGSFRVENTGERGVR